MPEQAARPKLFRRLIPFAPYEGHANKATWKLCSNADGNPDLYAYMLNWAEKQECATPLGCRLFAYKLLRFPSQAYKKQTMTQQIELKEAEELAFGSEAAEHTADHSIASPRQHRPNRPRRQRPCPLPRPTDSVPNMLQACFLIRYSEELTDKLQYYTFSLAAKNADYYLHIRVRLRSFTRMCAPAFPYQAVVWLACCTDVFPIYSLFLICVLPSGIQPYSPAKWSSRTGSTRPVNAS